jgi:hypothetical protein
VIAGVCVHRTRRRDRRARRLHIGRLMGPLAIGVIDKIAQHDSELFGGGLGVSVKPHGAPNQTSPEPSLQTVTAGFAQ